MLLLSSLSLTSLSGAECFAGLFLRFVLFYFSGLYIYFRVSVSRFGFYLMLSLYSFLFFLYFVPNSGRP